MDRGQDLTGSDLVPALGEAANADCVVDGIFLRPTPCPEIEGDATETEGGDLAHEPLAVSGQLFRDRCLGKQVDGWIAALCGNPSLVRIECRPVADRRLGALLPFLGVDAQLGE